MFLPPNQTEYGVKFYRNGTFVSLIGHTDSGCVHQSLNTRYIYGCISKLVFTLTIPAENMTDFEQESIWRCDYVQPINYTSLDVTLYIASKLYHILDFCIKVKGSLETF